MSFRKTCSVLLLCVIVLAKGSGSKWYVWAVSYCASLWYLKFQERWIPRILSRKMLHTSCYINFTRCKLIVETSDSLHGGAHFEIRHAKLSEFFRIFFQSNKTQVEGKNYCKQNYQRIDLYICKTLNWDLINIVKPL